MVHDSNLEPIPTHIDSEVQLGPGLEAAYERGEISMAEARRLSGEVVVGHVFQFSPEAEEGSISRPRLELVRADHRAQPGAKREAALRDKPKARTSHEKMVADADSVPDHIKVPPLGHDYVPIVINGGKSTSR